MVGVPLSRGCQTCRRRKVKCDEERPACLRCTKSFLLCPGYATRLKFMDEGLKFQEKATVPRRSSTQTDLLKLSASPSDKLSLELYHTFNPDLPAVKSLASLSKTYFVGNLPRHVGLSFACDLSMDALCFAHATYLKPTADSVVRSRIKYGRALAELQLCLADSRQARTMGTLCATMLLGIIEQLLGAGFSASIRHAGGAARLIEAIGPHKFKEPFAFAMFHALQGAMVIESILFRRRCFMDLPMWRIVCERAQTPFSALFSVISRLPELLFAVRELRPVSILPERRTAFLHEQILLLRHDFQTWRDNPKYVEMFYTTVEPSRGFPQVNLLYKSNKAVSLLCTYAAIMILLNSALLLLCDSETAFYRLENVMLANQICQSYKSSRNHSPAGSLAMEFAFRVAYLVPDAQQREWILEKSVEMASLLEGSCDVNAKLAELENCFAYLAY